MLRPEYENNLKILIITIPKSEIEIEHKTQSWVWDLLVITTLYYTYQIESKQQGISELFYKEQIGVGMFSAENYLLWYNPRVKNL